MTDAQPAPNQAGLPHHLLAALLIALIPALVADHAGALFHRVDYRILAASFATAYLLCAAILAYRSRIRDPPGVVDSLIFGAAVLCPVVIGAALFSHAGTDRLPDEFARRDLLSGSVLLLLLTVLLSGFRVSRRISLIRASVMGLVVIATVVGLMAQSRGVLPGSRAYEQKQMQILSKPLDAPFYALTLTRYRNFIDAPTSLGGGLARVGDRALLATGDGDLYEIHGKDPLTIRKLALRVPLNARDLAADGRSAMEVGTFRVTDILVRESAARITLFAAHHYWHRDRRCFVLRISQLDGKLDEILQAPASTPWQLLYETSPCLKSEQVHRIPYTGFVEAGGRLAMPDDRHLLLTTGDHEFDGLHSAAAVSQDPSSAYGKTVLIDLQDRTASPYSTGHRDPQGLFVTRDGTIWSTEHGPQGGDELNRIVSGRNYGWPRVTLGTEYGRTVWPLSEHQGSHDGYEAPVFSWTPAIGISNLIRLESDAFPVWRGDLLIGSLRGKSLWRVRVDAGRVLFASPIRLGFPVRDLEEDAYGRIIVWTDRDLLTLERATSVEVGESQAAPCLACHTMYADRGEHAVGPNLQGVLGRPVASAPGFAYSNGLRALGGKWNRERLDEFLKDPARLAPGNAMRFPGMPDPAHRKAIIDFLQNRKP